MKLNRFCRLLGEVIMAAVILLYAVLTVPGLLGYNSYSIVSGSMEPEIPVGSLVFSRWEDPAILVKGDVVVFMGGSTPVTHRVQENRPGERLLVTKGDANAMEDPANVHYSAVLGRVIFSVPRAGDLALILSSSSGKIGAGCALLAAGLLILTGREEKREENSP